jgi:hypothetical protein
MTLPVQTPINRYTYTGSTTFVYSFLVIDEGDLAVTVDGVQKVLGVDYTVSGVGVLTGGSISYTGGLASGQVVALTRDIALERLSDYQEEGDLLAGDLNADFDRLWMGLQDTVSVFETRALRAPLGEMISNLPALALRKGKLLGWDTISGQPVNAGPTTGSTADLALQYAAYTGSYDVGFKRTAVGAAARTVALELDDTVLLSSSFPGVDPTGVTDSTVGLQLAITAGRAQGGKRRTLRILTGTYKVTDFLHLGTNQHITCDPGVVFDGSSLPNENTSLFIASGQTNIVLDFNGASLKGARATASSAIEGSSCGLYLYSCDNVTIRDAFIQDFATDGIFVGTTGGGAPCTNVLIVGGECSNNRRNNLSIVSAKGLTVIGGRYIGAGGAQNRLPGGPWAGIDIEPDAGLDIQDVVLWGVRTQANDGAGLLITPGSLGTIQGNVANIAVYGGQSTGDDIVSKIAGLRVVCGGVPANQISGKVLIDGFMVVSPTAAGVRVSGWDAALCPHLCFRDVTVINPNGAGTAPGNETQTGFVIKSNSGEAVTNLGNITLERCSAHDTRVTPLMVQPMILDVDFDVPRSLSNIRIIDPATNGNMTSTSGRDVNFLAVLNGQCNQVDVIYTSPRPATVSTTGSWSLHQYMGKELLLTGATSAPTLPPATKAKGSHWRIRAAVGAVPTLTPQAGEHLRVNGATVTSLVLGAGDCVEIRCNGVDPWSASYVA